MKGLLLKDWFTLVKQMKMFLAFIVLFSVMPGTGMTAFAIIYAAMLPMTALAYDERSHWDAFAAMMPYSTFAIVFGKYVLGYLAILGASLLALAAQSILVLLQHTTVTSEALIVIAVTLLAATLIQSISLPFMFRFGTEKGRIFFLLLMCVFIVSGSAFRQQLASAFSGRTIALPLLAALAVIFTVLLNAASVLCSLHLQKRKCA